MTKFKIRTRLLLALAIPLLALGGLGVRYLTTINEVKVDGRLYDQVTGPRAVVADVALLAENQSRALIDAEQLLRETSSSRIDGLLADLQVREDYYLAGVEAWNGARVAEQPELAAMLDEAYGPSVEFYRVIDEELVPAVQAEDEDAMASAVAAVGRAYAVQRAAADQVLDAAQVQATASEGNAAAYLDDRLRQDQLIAAALVLIAVLTGALTVRSITRPLRQLEQDLPRMANDLRRMDLAVERPEISHLAVDTHDELALATEAFTSVVETSVDLAVEQARVRHNQAETLQHLGRRNQNLLRRMMAIINDLEHGERDAEALQELFRLDHIATRMRRNAESLLVLAGSEQPRRWSEPVSVVDVVRSAASEIEDYDRIDLSNIEPVVVQGASAADISHLLAELLENATLYSPPNTRVTVTGRRVRTGYQLAVLDQGLGLDEPSLARANDRILDAAASASDLTDSKLLGLHVVGRLADRHDTYVALTPNPAGGLIALVTLPRAIVALAPSSAGLIPQTGGPLPAAAAPQAAIATPLAIAAPPAVAAPPTNAAPPPPVSAVPPPAPYPAPVTQPVAGPLAPVGSSGTGAPSPAPTVAAAAGPVPSLRRRVRSAEEGGPTEAAEVVHGPTRTPADVRNNWSRLALGVRQARLENGTTHQEARQ
ncbi:MAG: ATP-binding protein [Acidimicrobiales bacterium]